MIVLCCLICTTLSAESESKIFGIGLSHTGTRSLTAALEELDYKIAHFPRDEETLQDLMNANWNMRILERVDGITDTPVVPYLCRAP